MKTFKSRQDVLDYFGAEDEEKLDKSIYNATECGAWARFDRQTVKTVVKPETWIVQTRRGISGIFIVSARRPGRAYLCGDSIPEHVRAYFNAEKTGNRTTLDVQEWEDIKPNGEDILKVSQPNSLTRVFTVRFDIVRHVQGDGLEVGTIVEGSEAEFQEFLGFPFTNDQFNGAIQRLEDQVQEVECMNENDIIACYRE